MRGRASLLGRALPAIGLVVIAAVVAWRLRPTTTTPAGSPPAAPARGPVLPPGESTPSSADSPDRDYVSLRMFPTRQVADQVAAIRRLAEVVEPDTVQVSETRTLDQFLRQECGVMPPGLEKEVKRLFAQLNPGRDPARLAQGDRVRTPPCPKWGPRVTVSVRPGSNVWANLAQYMGPTGDVTQRRVAALSGLDMSALADVGQWKDITLPYTTGYQQYAFEPSKRERIEALREELLSTPGAGVIEMTFSARPTDLRLAREVSETDLGKNQAACDAAIGDPRWPFDAVALTEVLRENSGLNPRPAGRDRPEVLLVADTGVTDLRALAPFLSRNLPEERRGARLYHDDDGNGYEDDVFGVTVSTRRGPPTPIEGYARRGHGMAVSGAALGGLRVPEFSELVRHRLSLKVANIVDASEASSGRITGNTILGALTYASASNVQAGVVNLSVAGVLTNPQDVSARLRSSTLPLIVAAAGNDGKDLDTDEEVFPAAYRVHYSDRLIVVAAHDPSYRLLERSNRGTKSVDLAAPGCQIPTVDLEGRAIRDHGTSLAAPLVSLVAGLLLHEGLSIEQARRRILASVDVDRENLGALYTNGRLNPTRALSIFYDTLVTTTAPRRGEIVYPAAFQVGQHRLSRDRILKLTIRPDGNARAFVRHQSGMTDVEGPIDPTTQVGLRPAGGGDPLSIALAHIRDITFRTLDPS